MIDLRQLQALRAVHSEGSITRAARHLQWSQPTVDYHLKNLDRLVGAPVLQRSSKGSTLTPAGMLLLDRGQEILTLSDRALADARELARMGSARLRFGVFPTAAAKLLPTLVTTLHGLGIEPDTVLAEASELVEAMNNGELDAALVYTVPGRELPLKPHLTAIEMHRDPLLVALPKSHRLASSAPIGLAELASLEDESWVFGSAYDPVDTLIAETLHAAGRSIDSSIRADDFQVVLGVVAAQMGVALIPRMASGNTHPGVVLREIDDPSFCRVLQLVVTRGFRGQSAPAVRTLAAAIRAGAQALG